MKKTYFKTKGFAGLITALTLSLHSFVAAQIPAALSDKIHRGSGVIDILRDVSGAELQQAIEGGTLYLGVDLNESSAGNESRDSVGVAIKQFELFLSTSNGDMSFTDFYTNTSASIAESGSNSQKTFQTLYGVNGSAAIAGRSGFNLSSVDDVIEVRNINGIGTITGAELRVTFVDTSGSGENETFFDYSAGFEEFAILNSGAASQVNSAARGVSGGPSGSGSSSGSGNTQFAAPSGAPQPLLIVMLLVPLFSKLRQRHGAKHD